MSSSGSPTSLATVESGVWQIEREWVVSPLSALKESLRLTAMKTDDEEWYVKLGPSSGQTVPEIYLYRTTMMASLSVKFAVTFVDQINPGNSVFREYDHIFDGRESSNRWGWSKPVAEPCPPGIILDDKLILHTRLRVPESLGSGSARRPLNKESQEFATRAYMKLLSGPDAPEPDVTLKMEDGTLPARRFLLAESSDYFKAMFQAGWSESNNKLVEIQEVAVADMKLVLQFINGELAAIPEERLHSMALATDRLQVKQLTEHCVTRLQLCLTLETLAETAVVADKMNHEGLQQACIDFAMQEENRSALQAGEQKVLKRIIADAPDLALKLMGEALKQGVPKEAQNG